MNSISSASNHLEGKFFKGIVAPYPSDSLKKIPVLVTGLFSEPDKVVYCTDLINTFFRGRSPYGKQEYLSYGSYSPLLPGTQVIVFFINNIDNGYIIGIDGDIKAPTSGSNQHIIFKSPNGSTILFNESVNKSSKDNFIIKTSQGYSTVYIDEDKISLSLLQQSIDETDTVERVSYIDLKKDEIIFNVNGAAYKFGRNGISFNTGEESATIFDIGPKGITLIGKDYVNIATANDGGSIHIKGGDTYVTGINELHLKANDARLNGVQKTQITGTTVNVQSFYSVHLKSMYVGIEAKLKFTERSLLKDVNVLGAYNENCVTKNINSTVLSITTGTYSKAAGTILEDGLTLSGMGLGASVSSSMSASFIGLMLSTEATLTTIGTGLLLNDPFTGATNASLSSTIAGSANEASGPVLSPGTGDDSRIDDIASITNYLNRIEKNKETYVQFPKL